MGVIGRSSDFRRGEATSAYPRSRAKIVEALTTLLDSARAAGAVRDDVDAEDVLLAVGGIWAMPVERG